MAWWLEDRGMKVNLVEKIRLRAHISNELARAVLAEFFCMAFLLFAGLTANAQLILSNTQFNAWIGACVAWGLALFLSVSMAHRISGANLNPAISFFLLTQGKISPIRFVLYVTAQNVGAFVGASLCFAVYYDAINNFDGGVRQVTGEQATAGIFSSYPQPYLSIFGGCLDQAVGAALLCIGVGTIVDKRNGVPEHVQPAYVGMLLMIIPMTVGMNSGCSINPARDFAPRVFTLVAGYGWEVFSYNNYSWFWIPIVCPMIGSVIGAWMYEAFIGFHMPDDVDKSLVLVHLNHGMDTPVTADSPVSSTNIPRYSDTTTLPKA